MSERLRNAIRTLSWSTTGPTKTEQRNLPEYRDEAAPGTVEIDGIRVHPANHTIERLRQMADMLVNCTENRVWGPWWFIEVTLWAVHRITTLEAENARLREALEQCAEYFDDRSDVDTSAGEPVANDEMRLLGVVKTALGEK